MGLYFVVDILILLFSYLASVKCTHLVSRGAKDKQGVRGRMKKGIIDYYSSSSEEEYDDKAAAEEQ